MLISIRLIYLADASWTIRLAAIALAILGLAIVFAGMATILKGRFIGFDRFAMRRDYYTGAPAYLLGSAVMFIGAALVFYSVWKWVRPDQAADFLRTLVQSSQGWGLLLLSFGFFTFVFGVVRLVSGSPAYTELPESRRVSGFRLEGLIAMLVGILLIAGGFWLAFQFPPA